MKAGEEFYNRVIDPVLEAHRIEIPNKGGRD
jgi:hypothetical protein